jgi:hypothetical protein
VTPFLSPLSAPVVGGSSPGRSSFSRAPAGFRPILGEPREVEFTSWLPPKSGGSSFAQRAGLRYERWVIDTLRENFGPNLLFNLGISFCDDTGRRVAIPDAIVRLHNALALIEIKYTHTDFAWWQLRRLYEPLLFRLTRAPIFLIEVCKSYDPSVVFPESFHYIPDLSPAHLRRSSVHVMQLR